MREIPAELKDAVLRHLCEECDLEQLSGIDRLTIPKTLSSLSVNFDEFKAILTYFERIELLEDLNARQAHISFILKMEASDFLRKGGFTLQETILLCNIDKLLFEIELLKKDLTPDQLDKANKVVSIAGAVSSAILAFLNKGQ